jgi:hypothetical protein
MRIKLKLREDPVKVGTKFLYIGDGSDGTVYTISEVNNEDIRLTWTRTKDGRESHSAYTISSARSFFKIGEWRRIYDKDND